MGLGTLLLLSVLSTPATAISVHGSVELVQDGATQTVQRFMTIPEGSTLVTGENSHLSLRFASGSQLRLGPNSKITLSEVKQSARAGDRAEKVRLIFGKVWARVMKLVGEEAVFEIRTQHAVAGVRGTAFWAESVETEDSFSVDHGTIALLRKDAAPLTLQGRGAHCTASSTGISEASRLGNRAIEQLRTQVGGAPAAAIEEMRQVIRGDSRKTDRSDTRNPKRHSEDSIRNPTPEEELGKSRDRKSKIKIRIRGL